MIGGGRALLLVAPAASIGVMVYDFPGVAIGIAVADAVAGLAGILLIARHPLTIRHDRRAVDIDSGECDG